MVDQLKIGPLDGDRLEGEQAHHHIAHVTDRRIGDEPFQILLNERNQGPIDDSKCPQGKKPGSSQGGRIGQHRQGEPQEAVDADLQQHPGKVDTATGGRLDMGQRQPGVQRENRHLDRKADHEGQEDEPL